MAMADILKRSMQIIAEGGIDYGKQYMTSLTDLATDAAEIRDNAMKAGKTVSQTIAQFKSDHGNPIKSIGDWFYGKNSQYGLLDGDDDEFDAGFDTGADQESGQASILDKDSMKDISNTQIGAMYQIGSKQVEANTANTASIVTTINTRASEMIASMNAINTSIIAVGNKLDNLTKLIGSIEAEKNKVTNVNGIINSNGNYSLSGVTTQAFEALKNSNPGALLSMAGMILGQGPAALATMGFDTLGSAVKIKGKSVNDWGTQLNEMISGVVNRTVEKLINPDTSKGGIFGKIIELFGLDDINTKYNRDYSRDVKNSYTTDRAVFDGITRHTIVSIIPAYLKEMTHALTGRELNISDKGKLTTKSGDYFGQAAFKGMFSMTNMSGDTAEALKKELGNFDASEIREAEKQLINGFVGATMIMHKASCNIADEQLSNLAISIALQSFERASGNRRSQGDWYRCLRTIYGRMVGDLLSPASNGFTRDINTRVNQMRANAQKAASSDNPVINAKARQFTEEDFIQYGSGHVNDMAQVPKELTAEAKHEIEKIEQKLKKLEEKGKLDDSTRSKLNRSIESIKANDYERQHQDVTIKTTDVQSMPSIVKEILDKLHDVIDVRIVGYGDNPKGKKHPPKSGGGGRRRRGKGGGGSTAPTDPNTGQVSAVATENGIVVDTSDIQRDTRLESGIESGVATAQDAIQAAGSKVRGSATVQALTRKATDFRSRLSAERAAIGEDLQAVRDAAAQQIAIKAGIEGAKTRVNSKDVSSRDQALANAALQQMNAALSDGDGKGDLQAIKTTINQIEDKDLKASLNKSITTMINRSESKEKNPAKSKLGKILLWAGAGLKAIFSPVIKIVKGIGTVIGKGFKSVGNLILRYFAGAAANAKAGIYGIKTGLFGEKDKDGNTISRGLFGSIADYREAKNAGQSITPEGGKKSLGVKILDTISKGMNKITDVFTKAGGWFGNKISAMTEKISSGKGLLGKIFTGLGAATDEAGNKVGLMDRIKNGEWAKNSAFAKGFFAVADKAKAFKAEYAEKLKPKTLADQKADEIANTITNGNGQENTSIFGSIWRLLDSHFTKTEEAEEADENKDPNTGQVSSTDAEKQGEDAIDEKGNPTMQTLDTSKAKPLPNAKKSDQGGGSLMESISSATGIKSAMDGVMGALGSITGGLAFLGKAVLQVVLGMSGMKKILNIVTEVLTEGLAPINDVLEGLYKLVKPVMKILSSTIKALITPLTESLKLVIEVISPIVEFIGKIFIEPLNVITNLIAPTVSIIGNAVKVIAGIVGTGFGYVLKILGSVGLVLGGIQKVLTFGGAGNAVTALAEGFNSLGDVLITIGKQWFSEGVAGIKDSVSEIVNEVNSFISKFTNDETDESNKERLFIEETYNGSAMDGGLYASGNTYNYIYKNMYGSGNSSQVSYGTYMNMKDHGCGPVALADAYSRRTGGKVNPAELTKAMAGSGNYNSRLGTSVGGMINTSRALGMNVTPGGVTYQSIRNASANNPITLVGSGDGFGTRKGNIHYMNVIGSDKTGRAYVSNPLTGNVSKVPINSLTRNSVLGLYGSGDSDIASKYHFSDAIKDLMGSLRSLASGFLSMFTGQSEMEKQQESVSLASQIKNIRAQLGEKYAGVEEKAKAEWMAENPQMSGESDIAYEQRWKDNQAKYILKYGSAELENTLTSNGYDPTAISVAEESLGYNDIFSGMQGDFAATDEAASKWGNMVNSVTQAASGKGNRRGSRLGKEDLIRNTAMIYEAYLNYDKTGTYHEGGFTSGNVVLRNGTSRRIRPDCTGIISAGIQELGYKLDGKNGAYGENSTSFVDHAKDYKNTLILDENGNPSEDWIVLPFSKEALEPGDITVKYGHASMPLINLDKPTPSGMDAGSTSGINNSAKSAIQYLNGADLNSLPWTGAMGYNSPGFGSPPTHIYRFLGRAGQGYIEPTELMEKYSLWSKFKNAIINSDYHEQASAAGITPAEEAYIAGIAMAEDSAQKITGQKSLTLVVRDSDTHPYAFGLSNWTPSPGKVAGDQEYMYGSTVQEQIMKGFAPKYFGDNPTHWAGYITDNIDGYRAALEQIIGHPLALDKGDLWGRYLNEDLAEATGHGVGCAVVPNCRNDVNGMGKYVGSAVDYYNWMVDEGLVSSDQSGYIGGSTSILGVNTMYNTNDGWDNIPVQAQTSVASNYAYSDESMPVKMVSAGSEGLYSFKNANNTVLFDAYDSLEAKPGVISEIRKQHAVVYPFTFDGKTYYIYNFRSSLMAQAAKHRILSEAAANGSTSSCGSSSGGGYLADGTTGFTIDTTGTTFQGMVNYKPTPANYSPYGDTGYHWDSTEPEVVIPTYTDSGFGERGTATANGVTQSQAAMFAGLNRLAGSGDVTIPPLDDKTAALNDLLGWTDTNSQGSSVNQYYITQDSSKYEMIQAILHNTFEIKSSTIEALLQQILAELQKKKVTTASKSSDNTPNLFTNDEIPSQVQRLAIG